MSAHRPERSAVRLIRAGLLALAGLFGLPAGAIQTTPDAAPSARDALTARVQRIRDNLGSHVPPADGPAAETLRRRLAQQWVNWPNWVNWNNWQNWNNWRNWLNG